MIAWPRSSADWRRAAGCARGVPFSAVGARAVMSPETGRETAENEIGMVSVFDLANVYSVMRCRPRILRFGEIHALSWPVEAPPPSHGDAHCWRGRRARRDEPTHFFIADLPSEASITTELIANACQTFEAQP